MIALNEQRSPTNAAVDFGLELTRPDSLTDPHPLLHRMRREAPVHYSRRLGAWSRTSSAPTGR
jgi:hypothetical protein